MKTIYLVRHSKSSWETNTLNDFDRPLNQRGHSDAPMMAEIINKLIKVPDIIYSSPAMRAITTASYFAKAFGINIDEIQKDKKIYESGSKHIINLIKNLDDKYSSVMILGHNPDMTSLVTYYCGDYFENMPTSSIVCIDIDCDNWHDTSVENGKIRFFEFPKKYK
jgi:phosphohistidine phosphatase